MGSRRHLGADFGDAGLDERGQPLLAIRSFKFRDQAAGDGRVDRLALAVRKAVGVTPLAYRAQFTD